MKFANRFVPWLSAAVVLLAFGILLAFLTFRQIEESADARAHSFAVLTSAHELLSGLRDAETGQRGYLLTGDETFLLAVSDAKDQTTISVSLPRHRAARPDSDADA